jgi:hypothetical protein
MSPSVNSANFFDVAWFVSNKLPKQIQARLPQHPKIPGDESYLTVNSSMLVPMLYAYLGLENTLLLQVHLVLDKTPL